MSILDTLTDSRSVNLHRPTDVLDVHLRVTDYWRRSANRWGFIESFARAIGMTPRHLDSLMVRWAVSAEPLFVRSHIASQLWTMSRRFENSSALMPQDLIIPEGYAWLETPIYTTDIRGRLASIRAVGWSTLENGVAIMLYSDPRDEMDELSTEIRARFLSEGGTQSELTAKESLTPLYHVQMWPFGYDIFKMAEKWDPETHPERMQQICDEYDITEDVYRAFYADTLNDFTFIFGLWDFISSQYPSVQRGDRAQMRRLKRANSKISQILIVEMRPSIHRSKEGDGTAEWSHRWRVRSHIRRWRDRRTGEWRETTVSSYIKGPEELPLIEKTRIYDVRR